MTESQLDYELFFDLSPDLLCIAGFDGYFKRINPAVLNALGYTEAELYSMPINEFIYKEDREVTSRAREDLRNSKPLYNFENRYQTKNGDIIWLAWTSFPVPSQKLIFAVAKDVTYKKRLESERQLLLEALTKTNSELKQLSLTTSHDLRSPLSGLLSVFDLLDVSRINDRESLELIQILKLAGENIKEKLNNYVDVLSEKLGEQSKLEETNILECLNSVMQSISSLIRTSKTTIHSDFSRLPVVKFNRAYLESIFLNLITNAIKYARPGSPAVVSIHTEIKEGIQYLIVADNGIGFDMERVKGKIFGMNQQFHNHQDSKGVGLYLVHSHVTSLGGSIGVESKIGEGTKFTIAFSSNDRRHF